MRRYILVAGVDYKLTRTNFRTICENRMQRVLKTAGAGEELSFKIFDFTKGVVETHERRLLKSGRMAVESRGGAAV